MQMSSPVFKLRLFGIATFLLYIISMMIEFPYATKHYVAWLQKILILVSFVIFIIVILLQLFRYYIKINRGEEEQES
jgi:hypothetical protein